MRPLKLEKVSILLLVMTLAFHVSCAHNSGTLNPSPSEEIKGRDESREESAGLYSVPEERKGPVSRCLKGAGTILSDYFKVETFVSDMPFAQFGTLLAIAFIPIVPFVGCAVGIVDEQALEESRQK